MNMLLLSCLTLPLVAAFLISRLYKQPNIREAVTLVTATAVFVLIVALYNQFQSAPIEIHLFEVLPGLVVAFKVESYGMLFALIASSLWLVTSIYAIGYMRGHHEQHQTRFYAFFAIAISSVLALAFSANLFTLFLCYEVLTLSTYPLVIHAGNDKAKRSGRVYLGILMSTSIGLLLPAIVLLWQTAGHLDFTAGGIVSGKLDPDHAFWIYLLCMFGIGKAALMPIHKWLPAAMVAPTPVSALLHAVAVVKAGVFTLFKITYFIFGAEYLSQAEATEWLIWLPVLTILLASLIAISKDNLKERLAYSTISQLSYIVLGIMLVNQSGMLASSLHIVMHAFGKIVLFFAAGAVLVATHKTQISQLGGLGRKMPVTFACFTLASLSIIGLPPLGGMWSKWYLLLGSMQFSGGSTSAWILVGTLLVSSLLNIWYLLSIPIKAFFSQPTSDISAYKEAPWPCLIGLLIPTLMCLYLFFYPFPFFELASGSVP